MTWESHTNVEVFNKYVNAVSCVVKEAYMVANANHGLFTTAINPTNVVYVNVGVPIPISGESTSIPIDFFKITSSMPSSGELWMVCNDYQFVCKIDKSRFKFPVFSKTAVKEAKKLDLVTDHIITDINPKLLYESVNKIVQYNTDTPALFYKILFEFRDGIFWVADREDNVRTEICNTESPDAHVVVSSDYINSILLFLKKYIDGGISIGISTDKLLRINHDVGQGFFEYGIAPIVDID